MPPSITAVVYGAVGNVSIAGLFMAGVVPGFMIGFGLMIYCYFFGPPGTRRGRAPLGVVARAARDAALPLMIPLILLGGILTGWFTPTEAGVVAVAWILIVVIPIYNPRHFRKLPYDFCLAGPHLLAAAHHDRRGECVRLAARLPARRDRDRRRGSPASRATIRTSSCC